MRLEEFLRLADNLSHLKGLFPRDLIWGELEQAVRNHWKSASDEHPHLVMVPSTREGWQDWSKDFQRHLLSGENVKGTLYYPKPIVLDDSSTVDGSVYCDAEIRSSTRTVISGDLVSRQSIVWCGQLVRSLVAPEIHIDQKIHQLDITGSIVCRKLRITPRDHLSGKIAGNLFVSEAIANGRGGKASNLLTIADGSVIGGIHVPCAIQCGDCTTVRHLQAAGDVELGMENHASVVKGNNIVVGVRSRVNQIYAQGAIRIDEGSRIHDAIAAGNIEVGPGVEVSSGVVATFGGEIIADDAWWEAQRDYHYKANLHAILHQAKTVDTRYGARSIVLRILPHAWYWALKQVNQGWLSELEPVI